MGKRPVDCCLVAQDFVGGISRSISSKVLYLKLIFALLVKLLDIKNPVRFNFGKLIISRHLVTSSFLRLRTSSTEVSPWPLGTRTSSRRTPFACHPRASRMRSRPCRGPRGGHGVTPSALGRGYPS